MDDDVRQAPPCAYCGLPEDGHTESGETIRELLLRSIRPKRAAERAVELAALRFGVSARALATASRSKVAPLPEARRAVVCMLRRAGMPIADIAKDLGWDRSALHARERKAKAARAAWDAAREREAGERLALAARVEAVEADDPEAGHTCAAPMPTPVRVDLGHEPAGSFSVAAPVAFGFTTAVPMQDKLRKIVPLLEAPSLADGARLHELARVREASAARAARWKRAARSLWASRRVLAGALSVARRDLEEARDLLARVAPLVLRVVDYQADADDCYLCGRMADGRHAAHCDLAGWTSAQVETIRAMLDGYAAGHGADAQACADAAVGKGGAAAATASRPTAPAEAAGGQGGRRGVGGKDDGDAETRSPEATRGAGKQAVMGTAPPPHEVAGKQEDQMVGLLRVGHEGHYPHGTDTAENKVDAEGAELRGSSEAVSAGPEHLNGLSRDGLPLEAEEEQRTGVQVSDAQVAAGDEDRRTLVQDCTRVAVEVAAIVARVRAEERARAERERAETLEELAKVRQAREAETIRADRAEHQRERAEYERAAWERRAAELEAERDEAIRLLNEEGGAS